MKPEKDIIEIKKGTSREEIIAAIKKTKLEKKMKLKE